MRLNHSQNGALFTTTSGSIDQVPIVFLHGFGAGAFVWSEIQAVLRDEAGSLAYDLPGHGGSLHADGPGGAGRMAKAIAADVKGRGITRAHFVGHSMGGAVASFIALRDPSLVASMTLLAPGAYGPEINHRLLHRYATASTTQEILPVLENMFGWNFPVPDPLPEQLLAARSVPGAKEKLLVILDAIFEEDHGGMRQGVIARKELAGLTMPVKVLWGTQDRVLPTRQSHRLPPVFAAHVFENTGHMLIEERPDDVIMLIRQNMRAGA